VPTFCRHNRFLERCPICSKTLPEDPPGRRSPRASGRARSPSTPRAERRRSGAGSAGLRVHRENRAGDDGYRCELLPGLRASSDALRLSAEIAFSSGRLLALGVAPPDLYAEVRELARTGLEQATWACFLTAYLSPLQGEDPFAGIRMALEVLPGPHAPPGAGQGAQHSVPAALTGIPLGPRTSHDPARGTDTLDAYRRWVERAGSDAGGAGAQTRAFRGEADWSPQRRFERLFERLALPGFGRAGRYELLVMLGRLGLYELSADSLHLAGVRSPSSSDLTTLAAKRVFAIGDPLYLERRAGALAEAVSVPVEALDLALANWAAPEPATLGFPADTCDAGTLARAHEALGL
jgi:hypothetical protein